MRVLAVTNNPQGASFRQRVGVYVEILRNLGITCEVAQLPRDIGARWQLFRRSSQYDGVFLHKKKLGAFDAMCLRRHARRIIYNYDDAIMYNEKSPAKPGWLRSIAFTRTVKLADMVLVGSSYLADFARPHNSNVQVLPIGLDTREYRPAESTNRDGKIRLVWIGSRSTLKYLRQMEGVLEEIGRRHKDVVLRIVCEEFLDLKNLVVEKRQWSVRTRAEDLATSDVGLAPLPDDPFTRGKCSFKVLEYSASRLPVVASPIGTNAYYVREGLTGFLCRHPQQWVDRINQLVLDPSLRTAMGRAGVDRAKEFDVQVIGNRLADLIRGCLEVRPASSGAQE